MNRLALVAGAALLAFPFARTAAQEPRGLTGPVQPRALADSTFAIGLVLSDLAAQIRTGTVSTRGRGDHALRADVEQLATVAAHRKRPKFLQDVPLWDFRFDSLSFEPAGEHELRVVARVHLASDPAGAAQARFHFRRTGGHWTLVSHSGLREFLAAQRQRAVKEPTKEAAKGDAKAGAKGDAK